MLVQGGTLAAANPCPRDAKTIVKQTASSSSKTIIISEEETTKKETRNGILKVKFNHVDSSHVTRSAEQDGRTETAEVVRRERPGTGNIQQTTEYGFRRNVRNEYEGWDNPFREDGEVSRDADLILRYWKDGRLSRIYADNHSPASGLGGGQSLRRDQEDANDHTASNGRKQQTPRSSVKSDNKVNNNNNNNNKNSINFNTGKDNNNGVVGGSRAKIVNGGSGDKEKDKPDGGKKVNCCSVM